MAPLSENEVNCNFVHFPRQLDTSDANFSFSGSSLPPLVSALSRNKRVVFALYDNKTHQVPSRLDFSLVEKQSAWITGLDLKRIKDDSKKVVQESMQGNGDCCLRGLEGKLSEIARRQKKNKKVTVRMAVFQKQFNQRVRKYSDPEEIAYASCNYSKKCKEEAREAALQDERDAFSIMMESRGEDDVLRGVDTVFLTREVKQDRMDVEVEEEKKCDDAHDEDDNSDEVLERQTKMQKFMSASACGLDLTSLVSFS